MIMVVVMQWHRLIHLMSVSIEERAPTECLLSRIFFLFAFKILSKVSQIINLNIFWFLLIKPKVKHLIPDSVLKKPYPELWLYKKSQQSRQQKYSELLYMSREIKLFWNSQFNREMVWKEIPKRISGLNELNGCPTEMKSGFQ